MLFDGITPSTSGFFCLSHIEKNNAFELSSALLFSTQLLKKQFHSLFAEATDGKCRSTGILSVIGASESVHQEIRGKVDRRYKMKDRKAHLEPSLVNSFFLL
jgi:hypothetical protein